MAFRTKACRCLVLVSLALLPLTMAMDSIGNYCSGNSLAGNSKAVASINSVLTDLVAKGSTGGFATSSAGKGNTVIYGLAQCRGDVSASDCQACLADAANQILSCNYQSDSRIWYDDCFMRYENANFVGQTDTDVGVILVNTQTMDNAKAFQKSVGKATGKATAQAATAGSGGLGRAKEQYTPFVNVYALAQCTRDLSPLACAQCLSTAVSRFGQYCGAQQGCQLNYSSCRVRYEIYPFYFPLAAGNARAAATDMTKYTKIVVHR
uniref:Gnk2-homologous domain-containing protein n=1 Tax=Leersia perrieri TaxID=77586 RepID=A0A0D9VSJ0_9ORYZ